jgi:hypothetical protein
MWFLLFQSFKPFNALRRFKVQGSRVQGNSGRSSRSIASLTKNGSRSSGSTAHHERIYSQLLRFVQSLAAVQSSRFKSSKLSSDLLSGTRQA